SAVSHLFFFVYISVIFFTYFFFFHDTATPYIYTLSLHDALPIFSRASDDSPCKTLPADEPREQRRPHFHQRRRARRCFRWSKTSDRKSTRLNSSHLGISYAVFCLKKKKKKNIKKKQKKKDIPKTL